MRVQPDLGNELTADPTSSLPQPQRATDTVPAHPRGNALAWSIINDHYLTDLPLLHAPHVIAITAMFLAVVLKPTQGGLQMSAAGTANALQALGNARGVGGAGAQSRVQKLVDWLAESNVDIEAVVETTQELISLYEVWESYTDKTCKDQIAKFVKARGLDK
jgi:cyclin C